jgi:succinate dehydrogenase / fumarate reductase cytochrome b subunit
VDGYESSFLARHQFLIYRLFSLCGIVPVGAYLVVHLATNALVLESPAAYQRAVYSIHGLPLLTIVEWTFIFIPLLFHAAIGLLILAGSIPNATHYPNVSNIRYTLQRATAIIALLFILWHVFHMHGWIHAEWWIGPIRSFPEPFTGANFRPFNAASTAAQALESWLVVALYAVGLLATVYHFSNGVWTAGITWGIWTTPSSQRGASYVCLVLGILLSVVGLGSLWGMHRLDVETAIEVEDDMYRSMRESRLTEATPEKRSAEGGELDAGTNP